MPIITISRGSYSKGKEIAKKVAQKLGYECISREVLIKASEQFNIPEVKLIRAVHDAPSILERFSFGKEKFVAYIQVALLRHLQRDDVVYHGLAGHFFVKDISHALKVRIIADLEDRLQEEMERENIPRDEALRQLKKDDEQRRKWSEYLYGIDTKDSSLYDLVIHIGKISVDNAVEIICRTASLERFRTTPESRRALSDLLIAAEVKAALVELRPEIDVQSTDGIIQLALRGGRFKDSDEVAELERIARAVPGVKEVKLSNTAKLLHTDYTNPWHRM